MRRILFALALIAGPLAAQQAVPDAFKLARGSSITVSLDSSGHRVAESGRAHALSTLELQVIEKLLTDHPDATGPNGIVVRVDGAEDPPAGRIRFAFIPYANGTQSVLAIENGFPGSFMYRARIGRGNTSQVTDVCQVPPGKRGFEHWPYPIDWIEISDIRPVEWTGTMRCE